jgi:hypothetical protein
MKPTLAATGGSTCHCQEALHRGPIAPTDTYAALGHWGQALYIVPSQKLLIVRYADDRDGSYHHNELLKRVLAALAKEGA